MPLAFIYIQFCAFAQKSKKNEPRKIPSHFHHIPRLQALLCHSIQNIAPYSPEINSPSSNLQTPMLLHRENQPSLWFSAMALSRYTVYLHHPVSLPSPRPSGIRNQSPAGPHFPAGPAGFPGSWLRLAGCDLPERQKKSRIPTDCLPACRGPGFNIQLDRMTLRNALMPPEPSLLCRRAV